MNQPSRRYFLASSTLLAGAALAADEKPNDPKPPLPQKVTAANSRINVALVGAGGQGRHDMMQLLGQGQNVVAVCDVDEKQAAGAIKGGGDKTAGAKLYSDHRQLLDDAKSFDAVIIGTPDHWHAPLCKAFMQAGKHVYCEKPLTRTIAELRELRELARSNPKVVTQLGNQGSAEQSLRRSVELIRAGVLGQVTEVHSWLDNVGPGADRPKGEDRIPPGFNWDYWCGPSPYRPYKSGVYHPASWRSWYDFGGGPLADFTCHIYNTALRALDLTYATKIEVEGEGLAKESSPKSVHLKMHFPARKQRDADRQLDPVAVHWYDGGKRPSDEALKDVIATYQKPPKNGCLIVGENGIIWTNPWNNGAVIKLKDDAKLRDITLHEPTKNLPMTYQRRIGHMQEWVKAMKGEGKAWSDFDFGGHLTEIGLTGVLAMRVGHTIDWDGEDMTSSDPVAAQFVKREWRKAWL